MRAALRSKLFLAASILLAFAVSAGAIELTTPSGKKLSLEARVEDGTSWVCLDALAKALGATAGRDPLSRYPSLVLGSHRVLFSTATAMTSVDGKLINFKHPAREKDGCVWVSREFLESGLPLILNGPVSLSGEGAQTGQTPAPASANPPPQASEEGGGIGLDVAVASDTVRITLSGRMATAAQVKKESGALVVQLPRGRVKAESQDLGGGIAKRLDVENKGRALRLELGDGYKTFETLNLRNPERLVILVK